jgi:hypothetical protein
LLHRNDDAPSAGDNHVYACSIASTPSDTGYLLPTNLWVCIQLRRPDPDFAKISRVMRNFFFVVGAQGTMQVLTIVIMARFVTGL